MIVDPNTLLFFNMSDAEAAEMLAFADNHTLLAKGAPSPSPPWVTLWIETGRFQKVELSRLYNDLAVRIYRSLLIRDAGAALPS